MLSSLQRSSSSTTHFRRDSSLKQNLRNPDDNGDGKATIFSCSRRFESTIAQDRLNSSYSADDDQVLLSRCEIPVFSSIAQMQIN